MDTLTSLKIKGHIQQTKKKGSSIDALEVLFTGARIERGQCTIYFNERISWSFIAQYFTILPRYYFRLPNRASDLLYYIFYLARQHTRDIEERGYFTIGFRAIQHRLQLPSEVGNTASTSSRLAWSCTANTGRPLTGRRRGRKLHEPRIPLCLL